MAYKRTLLFLLFLGICWLVGVTWAQTVLQTNNGSSSSTPSNVISSNIPPVHLTASTSNATETKLDVPKVTPTAAASTTTTTTTTIKTTVAKNNTAPKCVCNSAMLPHLGENGKEIEICQECKCQHEARNTTLIKVVVIIVIWIISILVIYMLFLMCLDPLLNKRVKANYQEHTNEDDDTSVFPPLPSANNQELNSRANVLNRVGHQQDKWKRQVREQRRHIYDRRTMLN